MIHGFSSSTDLKVRPASPARPSEDDAMADLRRRLVRFTVKLIWNRDDAEEIVQDAFKQAMATGHRLPHERYEPWMFRTTANLCLNFRRRLRPQSLADDTDLPGGDAPDARLKRTEQLELLRGAVAKLPDQQRIALILRTMEQLDYSNIAEIMALSVPAVRSHVHFARRRLAEWMDPDRAEAAS